ncbi:hypothetical protein [Tahibacter amnicola]|uniref:PepSY domain-containing protein n=1 Tax=Tahibacter amnicola TaxID=2976241 RepID=A0ABY6BL84_9GAMM|nr:hypothetical protein [Tahibacter amnicola]UXI70237.1 hypothetical protein N4264_11560 [Tahibacter amnicola]
MITSIHRKRSVWSAPGITLIAAALAGLQPAFAACNNQTGDPVMSTAQATGIADSALRSAGHPVEQLVRSDKILFDAASCQWRMHYRYEESDPSVVARRFHVYVDDTTGKADVQEQ